MPRTATTKKAPVKAHKAPTKKVAPKVIHADRPKKISVKRTYVFAVGRRKEAVARVRWHKDGDGHITINDRKFTDYFPTMELQSLIMAPLVQTQNEKAGNVTAKVNGGGTQGQAEAVRLGIARILVKMDPDYRLTLKQAGFLRRDPRVKERKKYGLKRARRAPQWQKR